jgi:oligopeptide/dipeptide ABC transporter ATP-binding protein
MTIAIELKDLSKTFPIGKKLLGKPRNQITAVNQVSLAVSEGETLGIVGESGCGKSTLAKMLVGLLQPTDGQIEIYGQPLGNLKRSQIGKHIQYVFQDPISSLNPRKTIRQIMHAPLKHLKNLPSEVREEKIREIFEAVNLRYEFLDRYPHEFSGGQAQRIGIARALAASAKVIILDEPVSALDVSVQAQILNLLSELRAQFNLTFLFISHDLSVIEAVCDRVAVLYFGSVVEIGPADKIFINPRHPYTRLLANSAPSIGQELKNTYKPEAELPDPLNPPGGCAFQDRCPLASSKCRHEIPKLISLGDGVKVACHQVNVS